MPTVTYNGKRTRTLPSLTLYLQDHAASISLLALLKIKISLGTLL